MQGTLGKLGLLTVATGVAVWAQTAPGGTPDFFEVKVRPVLANNCFGCHTNTAMGGLRLDSAEALSKGGKRGPAVVAGDPEKSLLIQAIRHTNADMKMPMGNKLKDAEIQDLTEWVKAGAPWPKSATMVTAKGAEGKYVIAPEMRNF
jgi:mono/diheme cytochrome c family protein